MRKSFSGAVPSDLRSIATELARRLGGHATPSGAMCRCPAHDDRNPSLSVRIGERALLFKCFAGCDTADVLRALKTIDARALTARSWNAGTISDHAREDALRTRARDLWDRSTQVPGSLAETYLATRGLHNPPPVLRFNRRTPLGRRGSVTYRPALVCGIHDPGGLVAVHRTFLADDGGTLACDIASPRRLLGRPLAGAVRLAPAGASLGLAEGLETALSVAVLLDLPVWATLGSERLAHIAVPDCVSRLVLLPDADRAGELAANKAMKAYSRPGRLVETIWPPAPFNDWNDVLRAQANSQSTKAA